MTITKTKVSEVEHIEISQESITAYGTVNTGGWTNAELIPRPSSSCGSSEFDFVAQPPDGIVLPVISDIEATYKLSPEQREHNDFIVYAAHNQKRIFWELEGNWILKSGVGVQLLPNTKITAEFKDGKLSGNGGCNQYFTGYTVEPLDKTSGKIQIGNIASTRMFCSEEINSQESSYFQALEQVKNYKLTDEGLILPYPSPSRYLLFIRQ
ncbi:MAG: META domain-containing protein [Xenococcaceae cyanobacterium MO_207.B15]|nr:META domain-containing protein [Xenococcaceae cyanobacterium MO_207.B15]